jgi:hypothetical protein
MPGLSLFSIEADGLESSKEAIDFLKAAGATVMGIEYHGENRGNVTDAEIIQYQKDGIYSESKGVTKRDITPNDADISKAAEDYGEEIQKAVARIIKRNETKGLKDKKGKDLKGDKLSARKKNQANSAITRALRKAADVLRIKMLGNAQDAMSSDGDHFEEVDTDYAEQRLRRYGVPIGEVFKASGRLLNNLGIAAYKIVRR